MKQMMVRSAPAKRPGVPAKPVHDRPNRSRGSVHHGMPQPAWENSTVSASSLFHAGTSRQMVFGCQMPLSMPAASAVLIPSSPARSTPAILTDAVPGTMPGSEPSGSAAHLTERIAGASDISAELMMNVSWK